jgi:hypothetical protein
VQFVYLAIAEAGLHIEGVVATIEAHTVSGCRHLNNEKDPCLKKTTNKDFPLREIEHSVHKFC